MATIEQNGPKMFKVIGFFFAYCVLALYTLFVGFAEGQISHGGGGGGGGVTGWPTVSTTKVITWANSLANAVRIGDGTTPLCIYTDSSLGPVIRPCTDANTRTYIWTDFTWALYDVEADTAILTVDPDASTTLGQTTFGTNYKPKKSVWFDAGALSTDGTQCAAPTEVTTFGPKKYTIICVENNSGRMTGYMAMPDSWDGGTITLTPFYSNSAADTGSVALEGAAACRGAGETFNGTFGTEVEIDDAAITGSGGIDSTTSGAITPNGTCAASDFLYFYVDIDATDNPTTAAATLHFLGVKMEYSVTSLSD